MVSKRRRRRRPSKVDANFVILQVSVAPSGALGQNCSAPMIYHQSIESCFPAAGGVALRESYDGLLSAAQEQLKKLADENAKNGIPFLDLASRREGLEAAKDVAQRHQEQFEDVVVFATGGSSLGGRALCAFASGKKPQLHFIDSIDPHTIARLFDQLELAKTGFIAISKSGETAETLAQVLVALGRLRTALGEKSFPERMTIITEPGDSPLRGLADHFHIPTLDHNPSLGGRYSVLSIVGLLPAMISGVDSAAVLAGAGASLDAAFGAGPVEDNAPAAGAAISMALARELGIKNTVVMPYVDRLEGFACWYRQLWAESLGKNGEGTTPITALGPVDQHSQLQLYLDGPADKLVTIFIGAMAGDGARLDPSVSGDHRISYLADHCLGDLVEVSAKATTETLARHGRPVRTIRLEKTDETALGALVMHFMIETVIAARLIGVNPFDQPAVEEGKALIRQKMLESQGEES